MTNEQNERQTSFNLQSRLRFEGAASNLINKCLQPIGRILEKAELQTDDIKLVNFVSLLFEKD